MTCIPEIELIEFAWRWEPFGTGDEWIFPEFGITPTEFYRRLLAILQRHQAQVTPAQQRRLTAMCHHKLGAAQDRIRPVADGAQQYRRSQPGPISALVGGAQPRRHRETPR